MAGSSLVTIIAAADGSALGNPGPAGWAWYIDDARWRCGGWARGTNNQGELTAVLDLLHQTAHSDEPLHILCDSKYVINSVTTWMAGWKRKGWKKADGKPVLNVGIMKALDSAMQGRSVTFEWVKGHAGHVLNEKADGLANGAARAHAKGDAPVAGPGFPGAQAVGAGADPAAPPTVSSNSDPSTGRQDPVSEAAPEPDLFSMDDGVTPAPARTDAAVDAVVELERSLLTESVRSNRARLTELLDPSWSHVCARGELWTLADRLAAADAHAGATAGSRIMELLEARPLRNDVVLVVWRETGDSGSVLRHSVWHRRGGAWKQVFQQGTPET